MTRSEQAEHPEALSSPEDSVLTCGELDASSEGRGALARLLAGYGLELVTVADGAEIPGSYWGAPEAGLLRHRVYVRGDTPVHSALHEACHSLCMDSQRRAELDTDAGGDDLEECGVCYLQILLAERLPGVGSPRLCADMDAWGYSFRVGSTAAWFQEDAEDARRWLQEHDLLDAEGQITGRTRREVSTSPAPLN
ncbi:MAG: hypothetical protein SX243_25460 [Acidobacteriota bacterium]|nr:hypothetical protein [Acidobacteriota bacterium]